jgi:predicted O-methyltransferase YrrM
MHKKMDRNTERFIAENTTEEDPVLAELYRQTHLRFVNPNMSSGHLQGRLLQFISMMIRPESILEIGTFTGYSTICLARGLKPGGRLTTIEINDELFDFAASYFERSGTAQIITQLTGDALTIIPSLDAVFDLVFIDGDKREYCSYYKAVIGKVKPGGFVIADNVFWGGEALKGNSTDPQAKGINEFNEMLKSETGIDRVVVPVRDGLTLIRKRE